MYSTDVAVSVRGHTSRRETECTFPKLKLKLKEAGSIKIGTHCGEAADEQLIPKYGRLSNEKSPHREALVYDLLRAVDAPDAQDPARAHHLRRQGQGTPLERNALLLEDDDDAMKRVGGTAEMPLETFGSVATRGAAADAARIAFARGDDRQLRLVPEVLARTTSTAATSRKPLWNVLAFDLGGGKTSLMMKDFDLAGIVVGRHAWFDKVWNRAFVPSKSETEIEVSARSSARDRCFRARSWTRNGGISSAGRLPSTRRSTAPRWTSKGREIARAYLDAFYAAIADDEQFYRPIVVRNDVQIFLDPEGTQEACAPKDVMRPGTPVNEIQNAGSMSQVDHARRDVALGLEKRVQRRAGRPCLDPLDAIVRDFPAK